MNNELRTARIASIAFRMAGTPTSPLALRALALIDGERVSSVPGIVGLYEQSAASVRADRELSDEGKAARMRSAAASRLANVSTAARELVELEGEHRSKKNRAMHDAVPPAADAGQVLIDLALAAQIKEAKPVTFTLERASERVRQALSRTPIELSGITSEQQARVVGSLVSPTLAVELGEEEAALKSVRNVVQTSIEELQSVARFEPAELVKRFGADWRLPGVIDSLMRRLHAENVASEAAEA